MVHFPPAPSIYPYIKQAFKVAFLSQNTSYCVT